MTLVFLNSIPWVAGLAALVASAATDLKDRCIPNELVALVAASGLTLGLISRPRQVWISLLIAVAVAVALGALARLRMVGFGDVKLIAAATLLVPPDRAVALLVAIALAGGVLSCVYLGGYLTLRRMPVPARAPKSAAGRNRAFHRFLRTERTRIVGGRSVPYGMAVFGGVAAYAASEALQWFYATS